MKRLFPDLAEEDYPTYGTVGKDTVYFMTPKRAAELPDVPTLAEAGVAGVEMSTWYGFFGPANLPREISSRLHAETMKILAMPDVKEKFAAQGQEPEYLGPEKFAALLASDRQKYAAIVKAANIKME